MINKFIPEISSKILYGLKLNDFCYIAFWTYFLVSAVEIIWKLGSQSKKIWRLWVHFQIHFKSGFSRSKIKILKKTRQSSKAISLFFLHFKQKILKMKPISSDKFYYLIGEGKRRSKSLFSCGFHLSNFLLIGYKKHTPMEMKYNTSLHTIVIENFAPFWGWSLLSPFQQYLWKRIWDNLLLPLIKWTDIYRVWAIKDSSSFPRILQCVILDSFLPEHKESYFCMRWTLETKFEQFRSILW